MDSFFTEHPAVAYLLITLLIGLVGYLVRQLVTDNKAELKEVAEKSEAIEKNYLHRFDDMKNITEKNHREVFTLMESINIKLAVISEQVLAQKEYCKVVQDGKKIK